MPTKLLFYAHNGRGLGHFSRLAKIGRFLQSEIGDLAILFMTQCSVASSFRLPAGADIVRIPGVLQQELGATPKSLPLPFEEISEIRSRVMQAASVAYGPDLFLVDHSPVGVRGDLLPSLRALRELPSPPKIVCGLLDMVGPEAMRRKWESTGAMRALDELYDEIWVYGSREIFDVVEQYRMPESVGRKVRYCGYIKAEPPGRPPEAVREELGVGSGKLVVVTVGGVGLDEGGLLSDYLDALDVMPAETVIHSILVTGPEASADVVGAIRERCARVAGARSGARAFRVLDFSPRFTEYMAAADAVISRGGYNTVTEAVSLAVCPIVVPLNKANGEQDLRAGIFADRGVVRIPDPARPLPEALAAALSEAFATPFSAGGSPLEAGLDFEGLPRVRDHFLRIMR